MVQNCCVPLCNSRKFKDTKLSFHKFPSDDEMKKKWLAAVSVHESKLMKNKDLRVCSLHFRPSDYIFGGNVKKLKACAIPGAVTVSVNKENMHCVSTNSAPLDEVVYNNTFVNTSIKSIGNTRTSSTGASPEEDFFKMKQESQRLLEENASLRRTIQEAAATIEKQKSQLSTLQTEVDYLTQENAKLKESQCSNETVFTIQKFQNNDRKILYYTGFEKFSIMKAVYDFVLPAANVNTLNIYEGPCNAASPTRRQNSLTKENQFLMVMMRLRRGLNYETLGDMFGVSRATAGKMCLCWINLMYSRLGTLNIWPHRNILIENSPLQSVQNYQNVVGSIDCTEFYMEKPSSLIKQSQCYSSYKSSTTLKSLIMTDPNGGILYMSPLFTGSISDKSIIVESGFVDILKGKVDSNELYGGDIILADKGFNVRSLFEEVDLNINIPTFRITGVQFTEEEVRWIREVAHERIHVERAIGRLKQYRILTHRIPVALVGTIEQIYVICCILCNFRNKLRQ